jgi:hypothetical protein
MGAERIVLKLYCREPVYGRHAEDLLRKVIKSTESLGTHLGLLGQYRFAPMQVSATVRIFAYRISHGQNGSRVVWCHDPNVY